MCDLRLLGDGQARPSAARALVVGESDPVAVDRDEALLFEDWRLRPDGTAVTPGSDPKDTAAIYTVNGQRTLDIPARARDRLRLRFINGFQRNVIAIKIENHDVQVMALDGQPSEPFLARNGAVVLAPGGRADVFVDAAIAAGATASILLHDGAEARPIARLVGSREAACPERATTGEPTAAVQRPARSAGPPQRPAHRPAPERTASRLDRTRNLLGVGSPRVQGQARPHRGAGAGQSSRQGHRIPPAWPPLPVTGPAGRWLETVLAGYPRGRARPDPARRLRGRHRRALADGSDGNGLGGAAPAAMVQCRVRMQRRRFELSRNDAAIARYPVETRA